MGLVRIIVPHIAFNAAEQQIGQAMDALRSGTTELPAGYVALEQSDLESRIPEEHERAREMDEKTTKLTASPSAALALLGFAVPVALREIHSFEVDIAIAALSVLLACYLLDALYLILGAVRTVERFGYGTTDLVERRRYDGESLRTNLALNLRLQELANLRRHNRNAAAFETLNRAFAIAIVLLVTALIALLVEAICGVSG